jgi:hypothetical protein
VANPTPVVGLRGSGEFSADFRPTSYRELFTFLEPNGGAPLNALLSMTDSESTDDPKFNHFRDEMPDRTFTVDNDGGYNTAATTIQLTSGDKVGYVITGSVLVNQRTGEVMRATANGNTGAYTIAVTRNVGSTSYSINDGDTFFVAGHASTEAATSPSALTWDPTVDFNYTQIFRQAAEISNTLKATYLRTGSKEDEIVTKALKLHMSDIERAMFFGVRAEVNGSTAQPLRYTGGLNTFITTNVTDVSTYATPGQMTEDEFDQLLIETVFAYGSKQKIAFGGARIASLLQKVGKARWQPTVIDGGYGIQFTKYSTFAGDLMVYLHPQFRQITGMASTMFIVDLPFIKYRFLQGRDTDLLMDRQARDYDGVKHEFLTDCGLEFMQNKPHAIIKNWTSVGA